MTKKIPITRREWALFTLRWIIPLGLLLPLIKPERWGSQAFVFLIIVGFLSLITNLALLLLIITERWSKLIVIGVISIDTALMLVGIFAGGAAVGWLGLIPALVAGLYFDWLPGLAIGLMMAIWLLVIQFLQPVETIDQGILSIPILTLTILALIGGSPITTLLSRDEAGIKSLKDEVRLRRKRAEQVSHMASEYMRVIYELTDVLSASKLDPKRVLSAAVSYSTDGLERVGVTPPLYVAILLFADSGEGLETVLRMTKASMSVPHIDRAIAAPGIGGVIGKALNSAEATISHAPDVDPELRLFNTFGQKSKTVACSPLRSGNESYGVLLIGSTENSAFTDMHIELMKAVANQAAASLNNARLYGSLLEQRDRLVGVEKAARAQLAGALHDGPTQGVAAIVMRMSFIRKLMERKPERASEELYKIEDIARRTTKEMRHILFELRPKALDNGLGAGLEQLAIKIKETFDQVVEIRVLNNADQMLDSHSAQTLFSIAIETLTNARKHAKAEQIVVQVQILDGMMLMEIIDNGIGFDVEAALEAAKFREGHLGLLNLQERAAVVEGSIHIESEIGKGTRTTVAIPMDIVEHRKEEERLRARTDDED